MNLEPNHLEIVDAMKGAGPAGSRSFETGRGCAGALAGFRRVDGLPFDAYRASDIDPLADRPLEFLIRGFLADGTAGMWGGAQKTLKTELQIALDLSVATGTPFLRHSEFTVDRTGPVLTFIGEGGLAPYTRRVRRIARAYGVDIPDDYIITSVLGDMSDPQFIDDVARAVEAIDPVLVRIDPYYAYHGGDTEAGNLFAQGKLLSRFTEAFDGRTFMLTHHFNEGGKGLDLARFTQAGSAQWVDSWVQVIHRERPNPDSGVFRLGAKVGSRQWGERLYEIDVTLGTFDMDTGHHNGVPSWDVRQVDYSTVEAWGKANGTLARDIRPDVVQALVDEPWTLTKSKLVERVGGKAKTVREYIDSLIGADHVLSVPMKFKDRGGRRQTHNVLGFDPVSPGLIAGVGIPINYPEPPK
jgi:hypothetical protein